MGECTLWYRDALLDSLQEQTVFILANLMMCLWCGGCEAGSSSSGRVGKEAA